MTQGKQGIRISSRVFAASALVLFILMLGAGILTRLIPSGSFQRVEGPLGFQVVPGTYQATDKQAYPAWRWLSAPLEVLTGPDGLQAGVIIAFICIVGGAFSILDRARILEEVVQAMARKFSKRRYLMLALVVAFFMGIGALLGIFEETIPLVPVAIALSLSMGWDVYAGLGMSILATGFGFSAAIANPFSIGVAQRLAGLGLFSGAGFRIFCFALVYALFLSWILSYVRKLDRRKVPSPRDGHPDEGGAAGVPAPSLEPSPAPTGLSRGAVFFAAATGLLLCLILAISLTRKFADYSMPIIALAFLATGFGSGLRGGMAFKEAGRAFLGGVAGILPGVVLILQAMAVKHIIVTGGVMDSILNAAATALDGASGYGAAGLMYLLTLGMNFFIGSATAKAFLLMPLLAPLADLSGLSRQIAVQAFAFGDGFSNMLYPTNAVLLIALGVAGVPWTSWLKKTWILQAAALALTMALLMAAVALGYK